MKCNAIEYVIENSEIRNAANPFMEKIIKWVTKKK